MSTALNILVAGGAGYIGSHMVKHLIAAGHQPIIVDDLSTGHPGLLGKGAFFKGDIADDSLLETLFKKHPIDAVMHFAAFIEVGESFSAPLKYHLNNVAATAGLLKCMLRHKVRRFIFSSSAAVYGEPRYIPIDEDHPLCPTSPYGRTKMYVETMLNDCAAASGLRFISLRYFNAAGADPDGTIGERHEPESHLIPLALDAALGIRRAIKIYGADYNTADGTCIRDYIHVSDLVNAHALALEHLMNGGGSNIFNLGNSKGFSVKEVIDVARRVTGKAITTTPAARRAGDPEILIANSDRIRKMLLWKPRYEDLPRIVETAWNWHRKLRQRQQAAARAGQDGMDRLFAINVNDRHLLGGA